MGTSLIWAASYGALTLGLSLLSLLYLKHGKPAPWALIAGGVAVWSLWGLVSGAIYAGFLVVLERKRTLSELSSSRLALWGVIAGALAALFPCLVVLSSGTMTGGWSTVVALCAFGGTIGLASAQLTLRAARGPFQPMLTRGSSPVSNQDDR